MTTQQPDAGLACNMQAISQDYRPTHQANIQRVFVVPSFTFAWISSQIKVQYGYTSQEQQM